MSEAEKFLAKLDKEDLARLDRLLATLRMVDGWCKVNRWIGKWVIFTGITVLIMISGAWDAIRNLLGWKH